jgi:seryl-tRNA(Sec) selenium transferase
MESELNTAQSVEVSDEDIAACADHFRIEGARRMQEACVADALTWFPANTVDTFKAGGVVQSLRELDAEVIARGYK